jgi:hypothetical protein
MSERKSPRAAYYERNAARINAERSTKRSGDESVKEYNARYYRENKDRLAKERAARYANDPEYREAHTMRSARHYWQIRRPLREAERVSSDIVTAIELPPAVALVTVRLPSGDEVETKVYTSLALIAVLHRTRQTLHGWEERGVIPPPAMRKLDLEHIVMRGANPRLYTEYEIAILKECAPLLRKPRRTMKRSIFSREVTRRFSQLYRGVPCDVSAVAPTQGNSGECLLERAFSMDEPAETGRTPI